MKLLTILLTAVGLFVGSLSGQAHDKAEESKEVVTWGTIDLIGLDALMNSKVPMVLLDARTDKYFDGTLIPGAKRLNVDSSQADVQKILPNKDALIVVYCAGIGCPASARMAGRLHGEGYANVIDYHHGIREWKANNRPIEKL